MTSPHPSSNHKHLLTRMLDHRTSHSAKTTCWGIKRRRSSGTSYEHGHLLSTRVTSSFPVTAPKTGDWNLHPGNNLAPEWLIAIQHHHWHGNIITNHLPSQPRLVSIRSLSWGSLAGMMSCRYQGTLHEMSQPPAEIEVCDSYAKCNPCIKAKHHTDGIAMTRVRSVGLVGLIHVDLRLLDQVVRTQTPRGMRP
ncbi:hypothetical protein BDV18DRAFT_56882 [Aspergillus unguis]